ncbi:tail completion protein gp17 [Neobacillus drentensis]|uniref:tail completion protein gp17 n=1 Tax=Neobacillus drentensis TaxID=220684 RepID=UPI002FFF552A
MSLNNLIINTLSPLAPTSFLTYSGSVFPHITFFEFNQQAALNADDSEEMTSYSIQVDIWSLGDYTNLVDQVKTSLKAIGFRRTNETEFYENDTKIYHKVLRFNFVN